MKNLNTEDGRGRGLNGGLDKVMTGVRRLRGGLGEGSSYGLNMSSTFGRAIIASERESSFDKLIKERSNVVE